MLPTSRHALLVVISLLDPFNGVSPADSRRKRAGDGWRLKNYPPVASIDATESPFAVAVVLEAAAYLSAVELDTIPSRYGAHAVGKPVSAG